MLVGRDAEVAERLLVAVLDSGAADHLRADEAGAEAPSLAPERLHADACHRREDEPRRHLDGADPPGFAKVDHGRRNRTRRRLFDGSPSGVATIPAVVGAGQAPDLVSGGVSVKDVILTPEGYKQLKRASSRGCGRPGAGRVAERIARCP